MLPDPSLHPTRYSELRPLLRAGEVKREVFSDAGAIIGRVERRC